MGLRRLIGNAVQSVWDVLLCFAERFGCVDSNAIESV